MTYALILAGGSGKRFWPLSREKMPKQFLKICSKKPMIEETIARILPLVNSKNIFIATNKIYRNCLKDTLTRQKIPARNVFYEPSARNTYAPIAYMAFKIFKKDENAVIMVMPSDHFISNRGRFIKTLKISLKAAHLGFITVLGIKPNRPETGFGYIKAGRRYNGFFRAEQFIEKPQIQAARRFLRNKRFFWNAGFFIFQASRLIEEIKCLYPRDYSFLNAMSSSSQAINSWDKLPSISFDYAIMEKAKKRAVVGADFGWMDIGNWSAVAEIMPKDAYNNAFNKKFMNINSQNCVVFADQRMVALCGVKDMIIVDTDDALMICSKDKAQEVQTFVRMLKQGKAKGLY